MDHDAAVALRLAVALAPWWLLRGRCAAGYPLLRAAAGHAEPGSDGWCAAHYWLGEIAFSAPDLAGAVGHFTAVRDAIGTGDRPGRWPPPGRPGARPVELGPDSRCGPGRPPLAGPGPGDWRPGRGGAGPGIPQQRRRFRRRHRRCRGAGPAGAADRRADVPGWIAGRAAVLTKTLREAGDLAAAGRAAQTGWPGPGRPATSGQAACLTQRPILDRRQAASRTPPPTCGKHSRSPRGPGALRADEHLVRLRGPVRRYRAPGRGRHRLGRVPPPAEGSRLDDGLGCAPPGTPAERPGRRSAPPESARPRSAARR